MYKARKYVTKKGLLDLYHSYIYPYLIYCIESWGNASACHLDTLYLLQKKIVRIINFSNYDTHTLPLFKNMNILPIDKVVIHRIGMFMFKYYNGTLPQVMNNLYIPNSEIHSYRTRQSNLLHIKKGKLNVYTKSFGNTSARVWNVIQRKININVSASTFKRSLKSYLIDHSLELMYPK